MNLWLSAHNLLSYNRQLNWRKSFLLLDKLLPIQVQQIVLFTRCRPWLLFFICFVKGLANCHFKVVVSHHTEFFKGSWKTRVFCLVSRLHRRIAFQYAFIHFDFRKTIKLTKAKLRRIFLFSTQAVVSFWCLFLRWPVVSQFSLLNFSLLFEFCDFSFATRLLGRFDFQLVEVTSNLGWESLEVKRLLQNLLELVFACGRLRLLDSIGVEHGFLYLITRRRGCASVILRRRYNRLDQPG